MKLSFLSALLFLLLIPSLGFSQTEIIVKAPQGDATKVIQSAINQAASYKGKPVTIRLQQGIYHISREESTATPYFISNTIRESIKADSTKHIAMLFKGIKNLTFDGGGAFFVTHGRITPWVMDGCENITFKNFSIDAADPTVTEMTVLETGDNYLVGRAHPDCRYQISNNRLNWIGEGWSFIPRNTQVFTPSTNYNIRKGSPFSDSESIVEQPDGSIRITYKNKRPNVNTGDVFQMRDGNRDEVAGFILNSKNMQLENIRFHFMGNFGVIAMYTENIHYSHLMCEPRLGSGRTNVGFADFLQISGCKGLVQIEDCRFEGAHDDPINIHGTHLKIMEWISPTQAKVRFMHPESYGFEAFFKGDDIEFVNQSSLKALGIGKIATTKRLNKYETILTFAKPVSKSIVDQKGTAIENVTYTPQVIIRNNYFGRIPTRGILVTTRRKVLIEQNTFYRTINSAILIADDAKSWYESGPVYDVTIRDNRFIECGAPVISIKPENITIDGSIHRNITIENNSFDMNNKDAVFARSTDKLVIKGNLFLLKDSLSIEKLIKTDNCTNVKIEGNKTAPSFKNWSK